MRGLCIIPIWEPVRYITSTHATNTKLKEPHGNDMKKPTATKSQLQRRASRILRALATKTALARSIGCLCVEEFASCREVIAEELKIAAIHFRYYKRQGKTNTESESE